MAPRIYRAALVLGATLALATGCASGTATPAASQSPLTVHADKTPIASLFPQLGDFLDVTWISMPVTAATAPGSHATRIQALVVLRSQEVDAAKTAYTWTAAPGGLDTDIQAELRGYLPQNPDWHVSDEYTYAVTGYHGSKAFLDFASGTLFLDVITAT
jgi:hypothetical protein